ncbi:MAG: hypothetical protein KOO61_09535 [Spirochaetales bacterium]|nr:hypothetical protein [Spirochaetales bacterium]
MSRRLVGVARCVGILTLTLALGGCQWLYGPTRIHRFDIVGADALVVGGTSGARTTEAQQQLYKLMPDDSIETVVAYNIAGLPMWLYAGEIKSVTDLNPNWVLLNFGVPGNSAVQENYLVEKPTGNTFYLSDVATNTYGGPFRTPTVYPYGDVFYMNGRSETDPGSVNLYRFDISSPDHVVGTVVFEPTPPEYLNSAWVASDGTALCTLNTNRMFACLPDGSVQQISEPAVLGELFLTGGDVFYMFYDEELVAIRTAGGELTVSYFSVPDTPARRYPAPLRVEERWYMIGTAGIVDLTDLETSGATQVASHAFDTVELCAQFGTRLVALYGIVGGETRLEVVDSDDWSATTLWSASEYILDSIASTGDVLMMGGLVSSTGNKAAISYDGELSVQEITASSEPVVIVPIR